MTFLLDMSCAGTNATAGLFNAVISGDQQEVYQYSAMIKGARAASASLPYQAEVQTIAAGLDNVAVEKEVSTGRFA